MGSKRSNFSCTSKAAGEKSTTSRGRPPAPKQRRKPTDFDALRDRFSDALSIVATATYSLSHAQDELQPIPQHDIGEDIITLEHRVKALRAIYDELDIGIREVRS